MLIGSGAAKYTRDQVGGKGYGLFRLVGHGFNVPDFFVIASGTDITSAEFQAELNAKADALDTELFSVRSSGAMEDGDNASFAGQYLTELNVKKTELMSAVKRVFASAHGCGAVEYSQHFGALARGMAIVVQKQIDGIQSGVMFSTSPQDRAKVLIERVGGLGETLVSGKTVPQTLSIAKTEISSDGYINELIAAAAVLEKAEGGPVDVEWTFDGERLWFLQLRRQTVLSDAVPEFDGKPRELYVYRDFTVFNHSVQAIAAQKDVQEKLFGFSTPIYDGLWVCGREFYSDDNTEYANALWAQLDGTGFFESFLHNIEQVVRTTKRRTAAVKHKDFSALTRKQLQAAYKRELNAYIASYVPMMMRPDDYLYARLVETSGAARTRELVGAVSAVLPPTYYSGERSCFLRAVASGDGKAKDRYIDRYEWKNNPLGKTLTPVTSAEFDARSKGMDGERATALLKTAANDRKKQSAAARAVIEAATAEEKRLVELIRSFTYYRTRTAENSDRYFYYIRTTLIKEIARRARLDDGTIMLHRADEIEQVIASGKAAICGTEIIKRKNGEAIIFEQGESKTYYGACAYGLLKQLLPKTDNTCGVSGEIACAGEVKSARVKVVNSFADAADMEQGCILVATMTTPDLTMALEKAVGIITDEGGITCHAAIIAREYAVPCLVGTKTATQVLRDGMIVHLDCINGCFTIIE